jgi:AraC family ethanolamine operon transcriptional activator
VRDFALAHQDEPLSIPQLCRAFRVSRRTLQYAFQEICCVSPGAYLRVLRLNGVRRALRAPERTFLDVQDLAAQWGFWHPSQFACDYKKLFGERPSDTLRRRTEPLPFAKS